MENNASAFPVGTAMLAMAEEAMAPKTLPVTGAAEGSSLLPWVWAIGGFSC